jgi:hypothetical protein
VEVESFGAHDVHNVIEEQELAGGEGAHHHTPSPEADRAQLDEPDLLGEVDQARGDGARPSCACAIDLCEQSIRWVRDDCRGDPCDHSRAKRDAQLEAAAKLRDTKSHGACDLLCSPSLNRELGHGVGDLLEEDGAEARVEPAQDTLLFEDANSGRDQPRGKLRVRDQTNTCGFQGAEEDVSDKLSHSCGAEVDRCAILPSRLLAQSLGDVDLEVLHAPELEPA